MSKKNLLLISTGLFLFSVITTPAFCMEQKQISRTFVFPELLSRTVDEKGNVWLWAGCADSLVTIQALLCPAQNTSQLKLLPMPKNGEITKDDRGNYVEWNLKKNHHETTLKAIVSVLLCAKNK